MMSLNIWKFLLCNFVILASLSQSGFAQPRFGVDYSQIKTGQLTPDQLQQLKTYLTTKTGQEIRDTIIIKYNFNRDNCWYYMDKRETDDQIRGRITRHTEFMKMMHESRPSASIFNIRESGNRINKIIHYDESILIDSTKEVYDLLFQKRKQCGSSAVILADGRFIITGSDSHSDALRYTKEQIIEIFEKKKIKA